MTELTPCLRDREREGERYLTYLEFCTKFRGISLTLSLSLSFFQSLTLLSIKREREEEGRERRRRRGREREKKREGETKREEERKRRRRKERTGVKRESFFKLLTTKVLAQENVDEKALSLSLYHSLSLPPSTILSLSPSLPPPFSISLSLSLLLHHSPPLLLCTYSQFSPYVCSGVPVLLYMCLSYEGGC